MLDHVGLSVSNYAASLSFYKAALAPLGYELVMEFGTIAGLGVGGKPDFWIHESDSTAPTHIAFASSNRAAVKRFYEAAIAAGGKDSGAPGVREQYHPDYYGAFVLDPSGHNIEAVCHSPEET